jgi:hypothetical protein
MAKKADCLPQVDLFGESTARETTIQSAELQRVADDIASTILEFAKDRIARHRPVFHMEDLRSFVKRKTTIAPDSPGRVLRMLRQKGALDYKVVSRAKSEYQILNAA